MIITETTLIMFKVPDEYPEAVNFYKENKDWERQVESNSISYKRTIVSSIGLNNSETWVYSISTEEMDENG